MEMIHKFKKEVLSVEIYSMIDYYPGNPDYIGKDRKEEYKESVRRGNYEDHKGRLDKEGYELLREVVAADAVFHFYIEPIDEITLNTIYDEAKFSIGNLSLDGLRYALQILESYNYNEFFEELDLLSSKFESGKTSKADEYRFKAIFKKHFKYSLGRIGKISRMFVNSLRCELKKRIKYLEVLKEDINKMIAIKMEGVAGTIPEAPIAETDLQFMPNSLHAKTGSKLYNDDKPINDNTMEINYERIFATALNYADDPEEMKEFCIRQQKEAAKKNYKEESFYKGLLKIVAKERENIKSFLALANENLNVTDAVYIHVKYSYEEIDLMEQIINEICNESKPKNKTEFSVPQWASIFYYADESKLLPNTKFKKEKREAFITHHEIETTLDYFYKCYIEVKDQINNKNNYPIDKLEDIIPFIIEHYKDTVSTILSDILFLKEEKVQNENFD